MTCTNLILKSSNQPIVCLGSIKSAKPIKREIQPISVMTNFQFNSQML